MNKQEVFNKVHAHIMTQGGPAYAHGECRYRNEYKQSCAIGCLIPDELYNPMIEGVTVRGVITNGETEGSREYKLREILEKVVGTDWEEMSQFLIQLQDAHDDDLVEDIGQWLSRMERIAKTHNLEVPHAS